MFVDKTLTCKDCGESFTFSVNEQEFYAEKGFTNDPGRCPQCRAARKAERAGGRRSGGFGIPARQMYDAVCAQCGVETQVPFQPTGNRPVYCRECYNTQRNNTYPRY